MAGADPQAARRRELAPAEITELATFLNRVRGIWKDRSPENRRELERRFEELAAGMCSDFLYKLRYEELSAKFDLAVTSRVAEFQGDRHALARVWAVLRKAGTRKTVAADDLRVALSRCETCGRDATRMHQRRPACEDCYMPPAEDKDAADG